MKLNCPVLSAFPDCQIRHLDVADPSNGGLGSLHAA
jgi:hypothetical protein